MLTLLYPSHEMNLESPFHIICNEYIKNDNNLSNHSYTISHIPIIKKFDYGEMETGLEEKFGGSKPFFTIGESWPNNDGIPMKFYCQFTVPNKLNNYLYRIFIQLNNDKFFIDKIELTEDNLKNQIIIEKPQICDNTYKEHNAYYEPFRIIHWNKINDIKTFEYFLLINLT